MPSQEAAREKDAAPFVYGAGIVPHGFDPNRRSTGWCEASSFLFSRLYLPGRDGRYHPDLAAALPRSEADGRTVRIPIREGVLWHDGEPCTAQDVAFTLDLLFEPLYPSDLGMNLPGLRSVVASGPLEVVLEFDAPLPHLAGALADVAILPRHLLLGAEGFPKASPDAFEEHPIGTGPYRFEGWLPPATPQPNVEGDHATPAAPGAAAPEGSAPAAPVSPPAASSSPASPGGTPPAGPPRSGEAAGWAAGRDLLFAANPSFHLGAPSIPRILLRILPDDDARARALAGGSVDLAHIKPHHVAQLLETGRVRIGRFPAGVWRGLELNTRQGPLADPRVRQAIDLVLDRPRLVEEALGNYGKPAVLPLDLPHPDVPVEARPIPAPDPTRAAILLEEAGWVVGTSGVRERKGKPLELRIAVWEGETFRRRASELVREWLESIGIVVHLQLVDQETYAHIAAALEEPWDGTISGWGGRLDPIGNLYRKFHSKGSQNATGIADPDLDRGLERLFHAADPAAEVETWKDVLARIAEARAVLPLVRPDYLFGWSGRLQDLEEGFVDAWHEFPRFSWTWRLAPGSVDTQDTTSAREQAGNGAQAGRAAAGQSAEDGESGRKDDRAGRRPPAEPPPSGGDAGQAP